MTEQTKILLSDLYRAAIGENRQAYYLKKFKRFHRAGRASVSWNWAAFFCAPVWIAYRRMWIKAIAVVWLSALGMAALVFLTAVVFGLTATLLFSALYSVALLVLPAMFADAIYYRRCRKLIRDAREANSKLTPAAQMAMIANEGGTYNVALVIAIYVGFCVGVPIFFEYKFRDPETLAADEQLRIEYEDKARLDAVAGFGAAAGNAITSFHRRYRRLPQSLAETALGDEMPPEVRSVHIDPATGEMSMVLALTSMEGRTMQFFPYSGPDGRIQWQCHASSLASHLVPEGCSTQRR